jgi:hypothetical protein
MATTHHSRCAAEVVSYHDTWQRSGQSIIGQQTDGYKLAKTTRGTLHLLKELSKGKFVLTNIPHDEMRKLDVCIGGYKAVVTIRGQARINANWHQERRVVVDNESIKQQVPETESIAIDWKSVEMPLVDYSQLVYGEWRDVNFEYNVMLVREQYNN